MEEDRYIQIHQTQDSSHEDEVIDTLSLSDLMIYDNNGDPHDFYQINNQTLNDFDDDQFEFSSELLKTSMNNSVVFCGKIIRYKESIASPITHKIKGENRHKSHKFLSFFKRSSKHKSHTYSDKLDLRYEVPIKRVSILASATKPRWYLFMFGFGSNSFSAQMHIRDLKKRQTSIGTKDRRDDNKSGLGSWRLLRFLGCGGSGGGIRGGGGGDNHHRKIIKKIE